MTKSIVLFFLIASCISDVYPCTCIGDATLKQAFKYTDVVFSGKVISIEEEVWYDVYNIKHVERKVTFLVDGYFQGNLHKDTIQIYTGLDDGDCGFLFLLNMKYIVYADFEKRLNTDQKKKYLYTDICHRTCEFNNKEFEEINKIKRFRRVKHCKSLQSSIVVSVPKNAKMLS